MKYLLGIFFAFCSLAAASPFAPIPHTHVRRSPPPAGTRFYLMRAKSYDPTFNTLYLTLSPNTTSYTLTPILSLATQFFILKYDLTNTYAFLNGDSTRQLALLGSSSELLYMVDVVNPSEESIPVGGLMEWATFVLDGNVLGVQDGSALTGRSFVAVGRGEAEDGTATAEGVGVALWDGVNYPGVEITPLEFEFVRVQSVAKVV